MVTRKRKTTYTDRHRRWRKTVKGRTTRNAMNKRWRLKQKLLLQFLADGRTPACADCRFEAKQPLVFFVAPNEDVLVCHSCKVARSTGDGDAQ